MISKGRRNINVYVKKVRVYLADLSIQIVLCILQRVYILLWLFDLKFNFLQLEVDFEQLGCVLLLLWHTFERVLLDQQFLFQQLKASFVWKFRVQISINFIQFFLVRLDLELIVSDLDHLVNAQPNPLLNFVWVDA